MCSLTSSTIQTGELYVAQNQDLGEVLIPETHFCSMPQGCDLISFPDLGQTGIVISKVAGSRSNYRGNSENFPPSFLLSQTWQGKSLLLVAFLVALLASSSLLGRGSRWHFMNPIKISLLFLQALGTKFQRKQPIYLLLCPFQGYNSNTLEGRKERQKRL